MKLCSVYCYEGFDIFEINPFKPGRLKSFMNDQELIEGLKQNQQAAFRLLVERYQEMVVSVCFQFLQNIDDAYDIAQEVFIEVYKSIHRFRQDSAISTWLYRIAVNKSLNHIKKNKYRKQSFSLERSFSPGLKDENLIEPEFTKQSEKEAEYSERVKLLYEAIESLPTNQNIAFTLHKLNKLSYKEVSEVMEVSLSSVESLMHRAKKNLQKYLVQRIEKGIN